jgi:hypothetical protein
MDATQPTYALTPPAFDPFGGPHFTGDDVPPETRAAWVGDPSSVPLAAEADRSHPSDDEGAQLDRAIFAALVTP